MSKKLYEESNLQAIADAIREKNNTQNQYTPSQMPNAILQIHGEPDLETLTVTENGNYFPSANKDGFSEVAVNVPNSYTNSDEGKVVKNGSLISQTPRAAGITENGTYDTTENNNVVVNVPGSSAVVQSLSVTQNGTYNPPSGVAGYAPVTVNVSGGGESNIKYAGDAYFGDYEGTTTSSLSCDIHGAIGAYAVLVIMHRDTITLPSGWMLIDNRINPKTSATGNINQEISIYKKQMTAASETVVINQASSVRMCATSFIFGSDVNISYLQTLELDDYALYRYTVPPQNDPVLFCISNVYSGSADVDLFPANITIGKAGSFSHLTLVTIRQLASIINSPIESIFKTTTAANENDKAVNRAYLYSLS